MLPEVGVVLDAGTGFYRVREHLRTSELDVFLTHAHLDHVVGLTYLFDVVRDTARPARDGARGGRKVGRDPAAPVGRTVVSGPTAVRLPAACRQRGAGPRGHAHVLSGRASRRSSRVSARLAGPFVGLRHRHDGQTERRVPRRRARRGPTGARMQFSRREGRVGCPLGAQRRFGRGAVGRSRGGRPVGARALRSRWPTTTRRYSSRRLAFSHGPRWAATTSPSNSDAQAGPSPEDPEVLVGASVGHSGCPVNCGQISKN